MSAQPGGPLTIPGPLPPGGAGPAPASAAPPGPPTRAELLDAMAVLQRAAAATGNTPAPRGVASVSEAAPAPGAVTRIDVLNGYVGVFICAFIVAVLSTPLMRRVAVTSGIIDRPDEARKMHKFPIAYLGGVAVFLGIMAGVAFSFIAPRYGLMTWHPTQFLIDGEHAQVPMTIVMGLCIILVVGLLDDVINVRPVQKVGGVLIAAALLAMENVGVNVAKQVLTPIGTWLGNPELIYTIPGLGVDVDVIYWCGTAVIAVFALGACNAMNLVDGLDGLCSGLAAIASACLCVVALGLAAADTGPLDGATVVLCLAVAGACLGFLPHNFNPAVIFLGDAGSLLLGYILIVLVLMLGQEGQTNLVLAGLVIFAVPIIDTALAIVRRKLAGKRISDADDQHLHHILKRMMGVKGACMVLYVFGGMFGALGIILAESKGRFTYALVLVLGAFIGVMAIKAARRRNFEEQAAALKAAGGSPPVPAASAATPGVIGGPNGSGGPLPAPAAPAQVGQPLKT